MDQAQLTDVDMNGAVSRAIELVSEALAMLDRVQAPADIGAHLDLALHRMSHGRSDP